MSEVRVGVIGCGGMGRSHMAVFKDVPRLKFTAAADSFAGNLDRVVGEYGVKGFADGYKLLDSGLVDAVVIATPHYFHPTYSIAAFERGLHVVTEKPVSVTAKAAAEVNAVHARRPELRYAVMYQNRTIPKWRKIKQIIEQGLLGPIRRVHWTATAWFRTQAYYNSGSWRATWAGEGGGVLLNQCPHNLDMLYWLTGMPQRLTTVLSLGKYHQIEVEDDVTTILDYPGGATGVFICTTGEAPGNDYLEIVGDRGRIIATGKRGSSFEWLQLDSSAAEHCRTTRTHSASPAATHYDVECPQGGSHRDIHENFVSSILDGTPLISPAEEGIHSVELANAMIYSGLKRQSVELPMDREAYDQLLKELIAKAKAAKA